jgi:ribonuclease HII
MEDYYIVGIDEAGRGPLAGPVIAGAVILNPQKTITGLKDSKLLTPDQRDKLFEEIKQNALAWSWGRAEVSEIDQINILQASLLAMERAVAQLTLIPKLALVDGNKAPKLTCEIKTIIGGDKLEPAISAASIVAKVIRDREMMELDKLFPQYGFSQHKGYSTKKHLQALKQFGPCNIHRRSYAPVGELLIG